MRNFKIHNYVKYSFFTGLGLLAGFACSAIGNFPYHYYTLAMPHECYTNGRLLGKIGSGGWMDLPLSTCEPDEKGNQVKCITTIAADFYSAKGDFLKLQTDLVECEKRCNK